VLVKIIFQPTSPCSEHVCVVYHVLKKSIAETISLTGHISAMLVTSELQISAIRLTVAANCGNLQFELQKSVCVNSLLTGCVWVVHAPTCLLLMAQRCNSSATGFAHPWNKHFTLSDNLAQRLRQSSLLPRLLSRVSIK
jgi:ascorbate-specific PTS system EIIC-type component UlaA